MIHNSYACLFVAILLQVFSGLAIADEKSSHGGLETVRLQLKWFHQFQFAGYYAAVQQGYYADEGLNVEINELSPGDKVVRKVVSQEANFGVGDSAIIADYANGEPIVALGAIFQHDPLIFISKPSSGIISPYEMAGKRIMFDAEGADEAPLRALLSDVELNEDKFTYIKHTYNKDDLAEDRVDVMSAYLTDQPYYFMQKGIKVNIINPQNYGFDFYGDLLFTSRTELAEHPGRAERFRRATLKGWQYALEHPEALIQYIHAHYPNRLSIEHLRHEAEESRKLIVSEAIPIGQIEVDRLRRVAEIYSGLKLANRLSESQLQNFVYAPQPELALSVPERAWLNAHPVIRVGVDANFPPYGWIDAKGNYAGLTADYMHLLEQRLGVRFDIIKDKPWPEILNMAKRSELDMIAAVNRTPERSQYLLFTQPYVSNSTVIVNEDVNGYAGDLAHLTGKRVAVEQGHFLYDLLARDHPEIRLIPAENTQAALQLVKQGKVDAYVGDAAAASYAIRHAGFNQIRFSGQTDYRSRHGVGIIKTLPVLATIIDKGLAGISQYEQDKIFDHWMGLSVEHGIRPETLLKYAIALVILFLSFVYWVYRLKQEVRARQSVEAALRKSENELRAILDAEPDCVKIVDAESRVMRMNRAGLRLLGAEDDPARIIGKKLHSLIAPEDHQPFVAMQKRVLHGEEGILEFHLENLNGDQYFMESHAVPLKDPETGTVSILSVTRNITERKRYETKLHLAARVFSEAHDGITITDANGIIVDVNPAFSEITGYSREETIGKTPAILKSGKQGAEFYSAMWRDLIETGYWQGEVWNRKKSGELYAELLTISSLRDNAGKIINYIGMFTDITQIKQQQQTLELMAHYDPLTELPNRVLFADRFSQAIAHCNRMDSLLAICYLDLDGFKGVNDTFGHEAGDQFLIEVAQRIKSSLREVDTVSRLGGDEFALLIVDIESQEQCERLLIRVHQALKLPVMLGGQPVSASASTGVTLYPLVEGDPDTLLRYADQAMYRAKSEGRNCFRVFNPAHDQQLQSRYVELGLIENALFEQQFCLHYQPKVDMQSGKVLGAEALIRWNHPQRGMLMPAEFLPIIEGTRLEIPLGNWVIKEALKQLDQWNQQGLNLQVSINISSPHLHWKDFVAQLDKALAQYPGVRSRQLELEVLESSVIADLSHTSKTLEKCRKILGVPFALDDFGTGYSSLTHMRHLSANTIKIDQSFVRHIVDDPDDLSIVEGIIGLSSAFRRTVIAEGVETMEHGLILLNAHCVLAQGYGIAHPMPGNDIEPWIGQFRLYDEWKTFAASPLSPAQWQTALLKIELDVWLKRLQACLQAEAESLQRWPIMSLTNCHLGRWIERMKENEHYDVVFVSQLEQIHQKRHQFANMLRQLYQEGKIELARAGIPQIVALHGKIKALLDQWPL